MADRTPHLREAEAALTRAYWALREAYAAGECDKGLHYGVEELESEINLERLIALANTEPLLIQPVYAELSMLGHLITAGRSCPTNECAGAARPRMADGLLPLAVIVDGQRTERDEGESYAAWRGRVERLLTEAQELTKIECVQWPLPIISTDPAKYPPSVPAYNVYEDEDEEND